MKKVLCSLAVVTSIFANSDVAKDYENMLNTKFKSVPIDATFTFNTTPFKCLNKNRSVVCQNQGFDVSSASSFRIKADNVSIDWSYFYDGEKSGIISAKEAFSNIVEKNFKDKIIIKNIVLGDDLKMLLGIMAGSHAGKYGFDAYGFVRWVEDIVSGKFDLSLLTQSKTHGLDVDLDLELKLDDSNQNIKIVANLKADIKNYKSVFAKLDNAGYKYDTSTKSFVGDSANLDSMLNNDLYIKTIEFRLFVKDLSLIEPFFDMSDTLGDEELKQIILDIKQTHKIIIKIDVNSTPKNINNTNEPNIYINGVYINNLVN